MKVLRSLEELAVETPSASVAAVGTFDGVHLGHAAVLGQVVSWARELDAIPAVVAFTVPPRRMLGGSAGGVNLITSPGHRALLMGRLGIGLILELEFDTRLAALSAEEFSCQYLASRLAVRGLVLGHDARIGRGGAAGFEEMGAIGTQLGFSVRRVEPVQACGRTVSSSAVREAIQQGDLVAAECMLGRRVSVMGTVVHGLGRGRVLGWPTVNLDLHREVRPPMGVYATWARVEAGRALPSVTNIGFRPAPEEQPTGKPGPNLLVETHLLEEGADLYGRTVEVEFVRRLREERRFNSDSELSAQIAADVAEAVGVLAKERR